MSDFDFDPTEAEPSRGAMPAVPPGLYMAHLVSFEEKLASSGRGKLREGVWEISEPVEFAGTIIYANINTHHENETAQQIGRGELSAICLATLGPGRAPRNSDELLGVPACIRVKLILEGHTEPAKGNRPAYTHPRDKNEIIAYLSPDNYNPDTAPRMTDRPAPAAQSAPAATQAPSGSPRHQPSRSPAHTVSALAATSALAASAANAARAAPWGTPRVG